MLRHDEYHADRDETVLLLHAGVVAGWMWDAHLPALRDHHVLVVDLPGFGRSNDREWTSAAATAQRCAQLVRERAHGGRAHVAGLSLGASVGLWLATRHGPVVRSAVLSGIAARPAGRRGRAGHAALLALWRRRWFWALAARSGAFPGPGQRLVGSALAISPPSQRRVFAEDARPVLPSPAPDAARDVLLLAGDRDTRAARDGLADLRARLPGSRAAHVPGAGHLWNLTHPELFDAAVRAWVRTRALAPGLRELPS
ncbi:MAG TPA: alpha/beta hydrolase [Pseudonocardia sp.]|nr:alpha/beta hydrolase [Pseudonocardia sp.]